MSLILQSSGGGQITIQEPSTASNFTQTLPAASGEVMVSGNMPAFSAYPSSAQSISGSTYTKVLFDTEEFDTNSNFASSRFTPTVAGYYQVTGGIQIAATAWSQIVFYKSGSFYKNGVQNASNSFSTNNSSVLIYFNGTTDYVELYALASATNNTNPGIASTYFQAVLVRAA
jgi:hypothetical protein